MKQHGFTIGMMYLEDKPILTMKISGTLHDEDYKIFTPLMEKILKVFPDQKLDVLVDAMEFKGWDMQAAWDDMKLGIKYGKNFDKIAFIGDKKWQQYALKIGNWFIPGTMEYVEDFEAAKNWLLS